MAAPTKTSLIDRVDQDDHRIGTISRGEVLPTGANFRTAHVFVFDHDGRLLLQRLAPSRDRHPERWGSSVAAYLHAGETYREAAKRRLSEELGLALPLTYVGKIRMPDEHSLKFVELYVAQSDTADIRESAHIAELAYWDRDELDAAIRENPSAFTPTLVELYPLLTGPTDS